MARILVVSLVLVLALLGVTVAREINGFRESGDTVHSVSLALAVQDLVQEAQRERGLSNGLLGGDARLAQTVADQRVATDRAMGALEDAAAGNAPGAAQVRSAIGQFGALDATRGQIDVRRISRQAAFQFYTDGISALNRLTLGLDQARDAQVRHGLQALYALGEAKEQTAKERGFLNGVFAADEFRDGEYVQFLDIRAAKLAGLTAFTRDATGPQQALLDAALHSENAIRAGESENIAIASSTGPLVRPVDPGTWWAQMTEVIDEQRKVQQAVGAEVRQRAEVLRKDAALTLGGFLLAALIAIVAEVALVVASVRAIVRPLGLLAAEADDVANHRLPEVIAAWHDSGDTRPDPPAPVRTPRGASAEIAAVAGALDGVQTTAFELASAQALLRRNTTESMANLARRNQNLVRRQLGLISEFEREELDPKALSNLFELDHLATRMRRNAESLLVLVGAASPRRWAEPIALTDVIRAGLSEVDDYRRVVLRRVDDIAIIGAVVSELAHMLAELIENGLAFSPPDMEVEIYGRKLPTGYLLAVVDHGVGMPVPQLEEANARLRGETDFIVASTRYLGHYVVGRLARRLGIDVELNVSPVSGIVARLSLPAEIIAGEKDRRAPAAGERSVAPVPAGTVPGGSGHAESAAGPVGGSLAGEAVSARNWLGTVSNGAAVNGSSIPGAPTHDVRMTGGSDADGAGARQTRPGGPAHSRPGFASPRPAPAPFAHFLSTPIGSGDGGVSAGTGGDGAMPGVDGAVHRADGAVPAVNGPLTGLPSVNGTGSDGINGSLGLLRGSEFRGDGVNGSLTGLPGGSDSKGDGVNGSLTGLPGGSDSKGDGANGSLTDSPTGNEFRGDGANGTLTGLPRINGSGAGRPSNGTPAIQGTAVPSPATGSLWQIPETATAAAESDPVPAVVQRTRNGLVKRNKRARTADTGNDSASSAITQTPPSAPVAERSPAEIRSMLSSFRAGHERGAPTPPRAAETPENIPPRAQGASENVPRATDLAQTSASPTIAEEIR